jgi:glycosyltransferase involved in cell wall biosynthesis
LIRIVARLLLPGAIRRPIADSAYRLLAWCRRVRYRLQIRSVVRQLLPNTIRRPMADMFYKFLALCKNAFAVTTIQDVQSLRTRSIPHRLASRFMASLRGAFRAVLAVLWRRASAYRHLLVLNVASLSFRQRLQQKILTVFLTIPDRHYRSSFGRFGAALDGQQRDWDVSPCSGIILMIGALGPGGAERQAVLTLTGFAQRGYGPLGLVCSSLRNEAQRFFLPHLESAGVPVSELRRDVSLDIDPACKSLFQAVQQLPSSLCEVGDYVRTLLVHRPAVAHFWLDECNIKGGLAAVTVGVPHIVLGLRSLPPCNFALHMPYMREGYRWLAKQPGVTLLNNSVAGARAYEKWIGLPNGSIRVVHNGFDFEPAAIFRYRNGRDAYRSQHGIPSAAPLIGTVIRLSEEKRPFLWLDIAAAVRRQISDATFLIVGDGPLRSEMEARAAREDLRGAVFMVGYEKEAFAAIAAMDVFLLTSRAEGFPNVLVEAQALGVPVVTTNAGGAPETVNRGISGWVLERDDHHYAADVLVKLMRDQVWLSGARDEGPIFVRDAFCVDRMLDETLSTYGGESSFMQFNGSE